jgi:hypothetical protein
MTQSARRIKTSRPGVIPDERNVRQSSIMGDFGGLLFVVDVILVVALAAGLIYGIGMWRNSHRDRATKEVRDAATDLLYRKRQ